MPLTHLYYLWQKPCGVPLIWLLIDCPIGRPSGGSAKEAAELFECRICYRHISSVGAGLARDAGTSFYLDDRSAAIAGKPAPTRD